MRTPFIRVVLSSLAINAFIAAGAFAAAPSLPSSTAAIHPAAAAPKIVWKSDFSTNPNDHMTEVPSLLSPVDSQEIDRTGTDSLQNVPVEAVPAPTAVSSGLLVLSCLAAVRLFRKWRFA